MPRSHPRPLRICTASEMRALDFAAERDFGIDARLLMENAGRAASQIIIEKFPGSGRDTEILVFAGKGNNAGDAFVVARRLICLERRVRVFHFQPESAYSGAVLHNFQILKKLKAKLACIDSATDLQSFFDNSPGPFTVVDGLLGTGLVGDLEGVYYDAVELINRLDCDQVVALDIPTGVSGDTGMIHGSSVLAALTISFGYPKLGHFLPPGAARRGELVNVDLTLPPRFGHEGDKFLLTPQPLSALLKERDRYGHKNSFGHTLLIGGSPGRTGAIVMAARACHKMGTGLVTVATWEDCFAGLMAKLPAESMGVALQLSGPEFESYKKTLPTYSSIVIGPGLGQRPEGKRILEDLLAFYEGPVVLDADALNLLADPKLHDVLARRKGSAVLTPHPGEMARLSGLPKEDVLRDPIRALRGMVKATHATVLLKGAATLIASTEDQVLLNHYPNDGMATAGSGDVLAGMIGGLLGQGMDSFQATQLGVYLHSVAGAHAAKQRGHRSMTAPDIIENIGSAFQDIKNPPRFGGATEGRTWLL